MKKYIAFVAAMLTAVTLSACQKEQKQAAPAAAATPPAAAPAPAADAAKPAESAQPAAPASEPQDKK